MLLDLHKFLMIFSQILSEFYFLNSCFLADTQDKYGNIIKKYSTVDCDTIYSNWVRDMRKKFKNVSLKVHWADSSRKIEKNQIVLDVVYMSYYLFEVNYDFRENIHVSFINFMDKYNDIVVSFFNLNRKFDFAENDSVDAYETAFKAWKNSAHDLYDDIVLDIMWGKKNKSIKNNELYFNVIYKNNFMFQLKVDADVVNASIDKGKFVF